MKEFVFPSKFVWEKETYRDNYGKLTAEPFERGFGTTVGNALRRVLLSSIPGVAITGLKIEGVSHEFSTIEGVKEDVVEIVLNLKQVAIKPVISEFPHLVKVQVGDKPEVTGADLVSDSSVEILNRDLHIATFTGKKAITLELEITQGFGYVPADKLRMARKNLPIGTILLDGIYTPVRKVSFHVENTRVGQSVDYEKLIIEVWTTGAITPEESIKTATAIVNKHFTLIEAEQQVGEQEPQREKEREKKELEQDIPITELKLSTRVCNALSAKNVHTLSQLIRTPRERFEEIKNLGKKSIEEIEEALSKRGHKLMTFAELAQNTEGSHEA